ncbi:LGFP repeat-containing protein [Nocardia thailandica]|uniref:LGFP repeat-containing protein n=1 Tax=Nocardia thailandica TaxID=257275 RepID=UPI0003140746|nr:esterase [Nocardia thailandica]
MNQIARRTAAGTAAVALSAGLLLACSNDDDNDADATTTGNAMMTTTAEHGTHTETSGATATVGPSGSVTVTVSATAAGGSTTIATPNGDVTVSGEVYKKYVQVGGPNSPLGAPEEAQEAGPNGGQYQDFDGGTIYWSPETGAHIVWGDIREAWEDNGGANGTLGYPTSDETDTANGGKQSTFSGGTITWVGGQTTVTPK